MKTFLHFIFLVFYDLILKFLKIIFKNIKFYYDLFFFIDKKDIFKLYTYH
jgi:hypothetical protein